MVEEPPGGILGEENQKTSRSKHMSGIVFYHLLFCFTFSGGGFFEGPGRFLVEFPQCFIKIRPQEVAQVQKLSFP